jgi:hypothetical protein
MHLSSKAGVGVTRVCGTSSPCRRTSRNLSRGFNRWGAGWRLTCAAPPESTRLIVFETNGRVVERFRAGQKPQVEYVEGCA